jgi:hypothetical protein
MAETGKMKTCSDAIEAILNKSVMLLPEVLDHVENLMEGNSQLGYTTREGFIQDAIRMKLTCLRKEKLLGHNPKKRKNIM